MLNLELRLRPSKAFFLIMLFILSGALVSIFCSSLPYYIQLPLGAAAFAYGCRLFQGPVLLRKPDALVALACRADNTWLLRERAGREYPARLCGESSRLGWVSILRFQGEKKRSAVVFYDAVDPVCYRRLLMRLKYAIDRNAEDS